MGDLATWRPGDQATWRPAASVCCWSRDPHRSKPSGPSGVDNGISNTSTTMEESPRASVPNYSGNWST